MNEGINLAAICIADGFGALLSIIMLGAHIWARDNSKEVKMFRMMLYTALFSCIADTIVFVFDGQKGIICFILLFLGNTWLFVSNMLLGSLWIMTVVTHISGRGLPKGQKILLYILDILGCSILLINPFYPFAFKVNSDNVYSRGPLFWIYIAIELIIICDSIVVYIVYRKKIPEAKHFPIWQFIIPVMVGIVIQSRSYGISLICPSLSIAICGVILGIFSENEEEAEILKQNEEKSKIILEQQEKLEEALIMAQSASKSKTTFLNNMSHDIRTPMNAIIGYTGLAQKHSDDERMVKDYLNKIENSSDYLLSLINEVLDMSRIEAGKMTLHLKTESLRNIIAAIEDIVSTDIKSKGHEFVIDIESVKNEYVLCDKLRIEQILINIISNSIKYTPENGRISFAVTQKRGKDNDSAVYEFCITDNGIGMDEEYMATIYEPFTRAKSSTVSGIQGTGLGMAITRNLIDMMGGSIDVQSKKGKGTRTVFELEFKIMSASDMTVTQTDNKKKIINGNIEGRKILLVEDNEINREIATQILEESGFIVDTASDGDVAVEKMGAAGEDDYDMILMDIQMPRMDGYEATRQIRRIHPAGELIPIIAMTANAFDEDKKLAIDAGMNDYLAKPIKADKLIEVISRMLR